MFAAGRGDLASMDYLVAEGASVDAQDRDRDSVLYYAASNAQLEAVHWLLERGADPNPRASRTGHTPLTAAARMATVGPRRDGTDASDYVAIVLALLVGGANPQEMYKKHFRLIRQDSLGRTEIFDLADVHRGIELYDDFGVAWLTPEGRARATR